MLFIFLYILVVFVQLTKQKSLRVKALKDLPKHIVNKSKWDRPFLRALLKTSSRKCNLTGRRKQKP